MSDNTSIMRVNLFDTDELVEVIASRMNFIDELKNRLPRNSENENLNYVDKSFFKRVFDDITDIEVKNDTLKVYFGRGISLYIDGASPEIEVYNNLIGSTDYRTLKIIGELIDLGEISIRTSPFVVIMTPDGLRSEYSLSLDQSLFSGNLVVNLHDKGINCWGGWGGPIRSNYDDLNLENSLMLIIQRMKQLNIDDYARSIPSMSEIIIGSYLSTRINLNPIILARLIVEYDLQDILLNDEDFPYFRKGHEGNLEILDDLETNIDYQIFIDLVRQFKNNYVGAKPKISLRERDN